uniref:Uncharacterized protein n=1 Tax=Rhizophora mucronata TaxID=61149 RepID=A0A2P2NCT1_RHIMU
MSYCWKSGCHRPFFSQHNYLLMGNT